MLNSPNIYLVGPMGSGKTSIGRILARTLKLHFYDSDKEIENRSGADIPWIFELEGEAGFRKREQQIIAELTKLSNIVLATGGGAILDVETRNLLKSNGIVVYLQTSVQQQLLRTQKSNNRPLLDRQNRLQKLSDLMAARKALYEEISDWTFDTDKNSIHHIADEIVKQVLGRNN
ncbi:shikimate kinase AroK [soil metagenome]